MKTIKTISLPDELARDKVLISMIVDKYKSFSGFVVKKMEEEKTKG